MLEKGINIAGFALISPTPELLRIKMGFWPKVVEAQSFCEEMVWKYSEDLAVLLDNYVEVCQVTINAY